MQVVGTTGDEKRCNGAGNRKTGLYTAMMAPDNVWW